MKIATLFFNRPDTRRRYQDLLRERLYAAGYEPHQAFRHWFPSQFLTACISGTNDAERAADVAGEVRGVMVKVHEV